MSIKSIFWNDREHRLRALWRIVLQVVLMIVFLMLGNWLLGPITGYHAGQGLLTLLAIGGSVLLAARWFDRRSAAGLGLSIDRNWWADLGFGCLLGIVLMTWIFGFELALSWINVVETFHPGQSGSFWFSMVSALVLFVCVGINEEMWMRGYLIPNIAEGIRGRKISPRGAVIGALLLTAVVFGLMHAANPNASVVSALGIMFAGIVIGLPFVWTGSLAIPIGFHITWNFFQGVVFGFPVSGSTGYASFVAADQLGPEWWTGGAFGPEAGLLGMIALLVGIGMMYAWLSWRYGRPRLQRAMADPPLEIQALMAEDEARRETVEVERAERSG